MTDDWQKKRKRQKIEMAFDGRLIFNYFQKWSDFFAIYTLIA